MRRVINYRQVGPLALPPHTRVPCVLHALNERGNVMPRTSDEYRHLLDPSLPSCKLANSKQHNQQNSLDAASS